MIPTEFAGGLQRAVAGNDNTLAVDHDGFLLAEPLQAAFDRADVPLTVQAGVRGILRECAYGPGKPA